MQAVQASYIFHRDEQRIRLQFENYGPLNKLIKSITGARFSKTYESWHIPCNGRLYNSFKNNLPDGCILTEIKETVTAIPPQIKIPVLPQTKSILVQTLPASCKAIAGSKIYPTALHPKNQQALLLYLQCLQLKAYSANTIKKWFLHTCLRHTLLYHQW